MSAIQVHGIPEDEKNKACTGRGIHTAVIYTMDTAMERDMLTHATPWMSPLEGTPGE